MKKKAFITGITGQDGSYLAEFLLKKNYRVYGLIRRSSTYNLSRISHLYDNFEKKKITLFYGDITDTGRIYEIINKIKPHEIYNLAAQSHVKISFDSPEHTSDINALGALRILEAIRTLGLQKKTKFYQASTSELFGNSQSKSQNEKTSFKPESPYGISKLFAYWTVINYRNSYNMHASNGILFNHESPRRGEIFITRKITRAVAMIKLGLKKSVIVGNLNAKRDWGHAKDYVTVMHKMLQKKNPDDYVIATGVSITVRKFIELAFKEIGVTIIWKGTGLKEVGYDKVTKKNFVKVNKNYFRPSEVHFLKGNASKAKKILRWKPKYSIKNLIKEMVCKDLEIIKKNK